MNKKQSTILISILALITVIMVVVWGTNKKEENIISKTSTKIQNQDSKTSEDVASNDNEDTDKTNDLIPISEEEPIVIASDIDTSNWKTYRNEEFGFEFRYPLEFEVITDGNDVTADDPDSYGIVLKNHDEMLDIDLYFRLDINSERDEHLVNRKYKVIELANGQVAIVGMEDVRPANLGGLTFSVQTAPLTASNGNTYLWSFWISNINMSLEDTMKNILKTFQLF